MPTVGACLVVAVAEVVVAGVGVGEQVPDDREDRVADGDDRASLAAAAGDPVVALAEEGVGPGGCGLWTRSAKGISLTVLPLAFHAIICAGIYAGELGAAASFIDDQRSATEATGSQLAPYGELILRAWQGRESDLSARVNATLAGIVPRGEGIAVSTCQWVAAILHSSLGRYVAP